MRSAPLCLALVLAASSVAAPALAETKTAPHWSYDGKTGPEHWSTLSDAFKACGSGTSQSPIDIHPGKAAPLSKLDLHYTFGPKDIVNNGHTVQADVADGNTLTLDGKTYTLAQFHFHTPSENHIKGVAFPMEVHFVNKAADGSLAVLAVMVKRGKANPDLAALFAKTPKAGAAPAAFSDAAFDITKLLPADGKYYRFSGSLTTPPCTEGVSWLVMEKPITASEKQISAFHKFYKHNNRPLQQSTGRDITAFED
ncbi:carbonic anhydrase [Rhizobium halophytocola]|uniref:Carbonic anhydrase n=1 Tax=Rhizobium halophytocola TaxID=735519 RepID=A0ABS4DWD7_9HYPH|nr:carbonic anhydrase family protein [Rhizobium halophytocola]MBP1849988.1 carbonic anhydrase [Rhizobium halophytocola]